MLKHLIAAVLIVSAAAGPAAWAQDKAAGDTARQYPTAKALFSTDKTVIGETFAYPSTGPAKVSAVEVTIQPGTDTGFHKHGVPLFVYILSGTVTVDYGEHGKRTYTAGQSFMEAMDAWHTGINEGDVPVRILAVYLGADGSENVIPRK